ncbi:MAG: hypothetical protein ABIO70_00170 [Pseudomonadota bacterium]
MSGAGRAFALGLVVPLLATCGPDCLAPCPEARVYADGTWEVYQRGPDSLFLDDAAIAADQERMVITYARQGHERSVVYIPGGWE